MTAISNTNSQSKYVDSLYSIYHLHTGTEELFLPLPPPKSSIAAPTALSSHPSSYSSGYQNNQGSMGQNGVGGPDGPQIPPFHPSNFHTIPVNRHLQTVMNDQSKRLRPPGTGSAPRALSIHAPPGVELYEATYSGIDVYELVVNNVQVMRRRDTGWVNATHILKVHTKY